MVVDGPLGSVPAANGSWSVWAVSHGQRAWGERGVSRSAGAVCGWTAPPDSRAASGPRAKPVNGMRVTIRRTRSTTWRCRGRRAWTDGTSDGQRCAPRYPHAGNVHVTLRPSAPWWFRARGHACDDGVKSGIRFWFVESCTAAVLGLSRGWPRSTTTCSNNAEKP